MEIWIVFFWSLKSLTKEERQPILKCKKSLIDFLSHYSGFGAMQKGSLWTCEDLEKGSYLHDFSAWCGSWQEKLHQLQFSKKRKRWVLWPDILFQEGKNCDEVRAVNGRNGDWKWKTDWYPLWICRGILLTFMSPKAVGCKESEIYTMRSQNGKKHGALSREALTSCYISRYVRCLNFFLFI